MMLKVFKTPTEQVVEIRHMLMSTTQSGVTSDVECVSPQQPYRCFMAEVSGTGAAASVDIYVSTNKTSAWKKLITLSPITGTPDGFADLSPWPFIKAVVTANTGTLNVEMGC